MEDDNFTNAVKINSLTVAKEFYTSRKKEIDPNLLHETCINCDTFQWLLSLYSLNDTELDSLTTSLINESNWDKLRILHRRFPRCLLDKNIDTLLDSCITAGNVTNIKWLIGISRCDFLKMKDRILAQCKENTRVSDWIKSFTKPNLDYNKEFVRNCISGDKRQTRRYKSMVGLSSILNDYYLLRDIIIGASTSTVRWLLQISITPTDIAISQYMDLERPSPMLDVINSATLSLYFPSRVFYEACINNDVDCLKSLVTHVPKGIIVASQMFNDVCVFGYTDVAKIIYDYDKSVLIKDKILDTLVNVKWRNTYLWLAMFHKSGIMGVVKDICDRNMLEEAEKLKAILVGFKYTTRNGIIKGYSVDAQVKKIMKTYQSLEIVVETNNGVTECLICFNTECDYYVQTCGKGHWVCTPCFLQVENEIGKRCVYCTVAHSKLYFTEGLKDVTPE